MLGHVEAIVGRRDAHRRLEAARRGALPADGAEEAALRVEDPEAVGARIGNVEQALVVRDPLRVDEVLPGVRAEAVAA